MQLGPRSSKRLPRKARLVAPVGVVVGLVLSGCVSNEKIKVAADGAPQYQNLQISYDIASTPELQHLDRPSPLVQQTAGVETSHENSSQSSRPWTPRRVHLELQYPCPGVHPAFARATLRIVTDAKKIRPEPKPATSNWSAAFSFSRASVSYSQRPSPAGAATNPSGVEPARLAEDDDRSVTEEVLYIDLPKTELDEVLGELAKTQFFEKPSNPDGTSHVLVVLNNKGRCEKGWSSEEHLDRLVELLRRHGAPLPPPAKKA